MSENRSTPPFKTLGTHLKYLREQQKESVAEVSGAVEIDTERLERIEQGVERPAEDILMLLINHFGMPDQEAVQLWELAGYDGNSAEKFSFTENTAPEGPKPVVMIIGIDVRTMYADGLDVNVTPAGMTLSFTQAADQNKRLPVARVGLSHDQAEKVIKTLQEALVKAEHLKNPRRLPPPKDL